MNRNIYLSELEILKGIAETLNEGTELKSMLGDCLRKLLQLTSLEAGWIFLINQEGEYELVAAESLPPALTNPKHQALTQGDCWCVSRFRNGTLTKASNIMECKRLENARLGNWGDTYGLVYHATVPLKAGDEQFGLLNVAVANKEKFEAHELSLLESIAYQIGTALKRIHLTMKEQDIKIAEERNRLARDLHDSVNQLLYSINVTSSAGIRLAKEQPIKEVLSDIQRMSQHAQAEMKALIWQLRPAGLAEGLACSLKKYGEMLGLEVDLSVEGISMLTSLQEETLWRIAQEAFHNTLKYSGEHKVNIILHYGKDTVVMIVSDDGIGFQYAEEACLPSIGLKSMEERIKSMNGKMNMHSKRGKGTSLKVELPI